MKLPIIFWDAQFFVLLDYRSTLPQGPRQKHQITHSFQLVPRVDREDDGNGVEMGEFLLTSLFTFCRINIWVCFEKKLYLSWIDQESYTNMLYMIFLWHWKWVKYLRSIP